MKKVLSVLLALCMMLCILPVVNGEENESVDFWVTTDNHLQSLKRTGDVREAENYSADQLYFDASNQGQMKNISEAVTREFLNEFAASDTEILLISGDLTVSGHKTDHEEFVKMLNETLEKARAQGKTKRIFVINGNHDIVPDGEEKCGSAEEFKAYYAGFGYDQALAADENSCSYAVDLNEGFRLLAIDSCVYGEDYGYFEKDRLSWVEEQVKTAKAEGKTVIAMMHHSILYHFSVQDMMKDSEKFAAAFADMGLTHIFTGHLHGNDIAEAVTKKGNKLYDIMTGSVVTAPCSYRKVTFSKQAVDIATDYVTGVDTDYLPEGLNDAQLKTITGDFPAYAKGYFTAGMRNWLGRYIGSAAVLAKKLKIGSDTKVYEALDYILSCVNHVLEMPLYDTENTPGTFDSIEELSGAYGYTLPATDYTGVYEIVGKVIGDFFAGDETVGVDSPEIELLYSIVSAGIVKAVSDMLTGGSDSETTVKLFEAIKVRTDILSVTPAGRLIAGKAAADVLVKLILEPILAGICTDEYTPGDLNVTLQGPDSMTGDAAAPSPLSFLQRLADYIRKVFAVLRSALGIR